MRPPPGLWPFLGFRDPPTDYRDGPVGTNLSGFPVKDSYLLLGTRQQGREQPGWSPRVAGGSLPQSQLPLPIKHTPPPGTSLVFHPWGSLTVGVWPQLPDPGLGLSPRTCDKRALGSLPSAGAQLWPYSSLQRLAFPDGQGWAARAQQPETPAWHIAAGRPHGAPARGQAALRGHSQARMSS